MGRSAEYDLRYFRVFHYSPFVTQITKSIFLQKAKVFIHFTGFSIGIGLGTSQHVSAVRDLVYLLSRETNFADNIDASTFASMTLFDVTK